MDMELGMKTLTVYDTLLDTYVIHDEVCEMIVPDSRPDIMRIICAEGAVSIKEKIAEDGKIKISGIVQGCVLYTSEGDERMQRLEVSMPFSKSFDAADVSSHTQIYTKARLRTFDARDMNPRKISVKAGIGISVSVYGESEISLCTDVLHAEEYALELKRRNVSVYAPLAVRCRNFTITEDVELASNAANLAHVLRSDTQMNITDMKIIGNKAIIKGSAYLVYTFLTDDDTVECCEHELPFSQIIDAEGMNEDCRLRVKLSVQSTELEPQHDMSGEVRFLTAAIQADACVFAYFDGDLETVEDIYSTKYRIKCDFTSQALPAFSEHVSKRISVTETIETACTPGSVSDVSLEIEPPCKRCEEGGEMLICEGVIRILYKGEEGAMYCASRRCSVVCPLGQESSAVYDCTVKLGGKSYTCTGGNEVIVRFFADFDADAKTVENVVALAAVDVDTEDCKRGEDMPSVIIKYINTDVPLWDTAKHYNTTVREIAAANALEDPEMIRAGSMLLIPKVR